MPSTRHLAVACLLTGTALLTGCSSSSGPSTSTSSEPGGAQPTWSSSASASGTDLSALAKKAQCTRTKILDIESLPAPKPTSSLECEPASLNFVQISIYRNAGDLDAAVAAIRATFAKGTRAALVQGPNWLAIYLPKVGAAPDLQDYQITLNYLSIAEELHKRMGGELIGIAP